MKKIIFVITSLQNLGGTERVVVTLANGLSELYDVTILSQNTNGKANAYKLNSTVKDVKFNKGNLKFLLSIRKYIKFVNPDYVVIHTMSKLTPMLILSGIKAKNIWSMEHISYEFHNRLFKRLRSILYSRLDKILVFTEDQKNIYLNFNENVDIIKNPCPIETTNLPYNIHSKDIISIGRLTYQKGYDLLIESWSIIEHKYPDWSLNIYGIGEDEGKLLALIKKHSLNNVYLRGQVLEVCEVYDKASFYVMSSRYEGLPMVLIEAQARGLPIVSLDCPTGPKQIVKDSVNGILIPSINSIELSKGIETLINNSLLRKQMSKNSIELSKQFLTREVINSWVNLFESNSK